MKRGRLRGSVSRFLVFVGGLMMGLHIDATSAPAPQVRAWWFVAVAAIVTVLGVAIG